MSEVTERDIEILRHMLGLNRSRESYRNYYVTSPGDAELLSLERRGLVITGPTPGFIGSGDVVFMATDCGKRIAEANPPKDTRTKAQRRYAMFLDIADIDPDLTFGRFLTDPAWADARAKA